MSRAAPSASHVAQLDGLRALAVLAVMVRHFVPATLHVVDLGRFGVILFFVLSGYLITGILLDCRERLDRTGESPRLVAIRFYARRFLRIFPIYYATVLTLFALSLTARLGGLAAFRPVREQVGWLLTYTFNIHYGVTLQAAGPLTHVWSLCVEEQFYLVWPSILLLAPRRMLLPGLIGVAALGPAYRFVGLLAHWGYPAVFFVTLGCLDSLALGGLLALLQRRGANGAASAQHLVRLALPVGIGLLVAQGIAPGSFPWPFSDTAIAAISLWLVGTATIGFRGLSGRLLEARAAQYVGKVSYGLYLYHIPVLTFAYVPLGLLGIDEESLGWALPLLLGAVSIGMAALSWELFERPINRLKRRFPYFSTPEPA